MSEIFHHPMGDSEGERNLFLIRIQRKGVSRPPMILPGIETVLTVCSGQEDATAYIASERAAGPCRVWIAYIGDIPETRFVEQL